MTNARMHALARVYVTPPPPVPPYWGYWGVGVTDETGKTK